DAPIPDSSKRPWKITREWALLPSVAGQKISLASVEGHRLEATVGMPQRGQSFFQLGIELDGKFTLGSFVLKLSDDGYEIIGDLSLTNVPSSLNTKQIQEIVRAVYAWIAAQNNRFEYAKDPGAPVQAFVSVDDYTRGIIASVKGNKLKHELETQSASLLRGRQKWAKKPEVHLRLTLQRALVEAEKDFGPIPSRWPRAEIRELVTLIEVAETRYGIKVDTARLNRVKKYLAGRGPNDAGSVSIDVLTGGVLAAAGAAASAAGAIAGFFGKKDSVKPIVAANGPAPQMPTILLHAASGSTAPDFIAKGYENISFGRDSAQNPLAYTTDRMISKKHFEIRKSKQGWVIQDLGSANGTRLIRGNATIQVRQEYVPLEPGDIIEVATNRWVFGTADPALGKLAAATVETSERAQILFSAIGPEDPLADDVVELAYGMQEIGSLEFKNILYGLILRVAERLNNSRPEGVVQAVILNQLIEAAGAKQWPEMKELFARDDIKLADKALMKAIKSLEEPPSIAPSESPVFELVGLYPAFGRYASTGNASVSIGRHAGGKDHFIPAGEAVELPEAPGSAHIRTFHSVGLDHARIVYEQGQFFVVPEDPNGLVMVQGKIVREKTPLTEGVMIGFGETEYQFHVKGQVQANLDAPWKKIFEEVEFDFIKVVMKKAAPATVENIQAALDSGNPEELLLALADAPDISVAFDGGEAKIHRRHAVFSGVIDILEEAIGRRPKAKRIIPESDLLEILEDARAGKSVEVPVVLAEEPRLLLGDAPEQRFIGSPATKEIGEYAGTTDQGRGYGHANEDAVGSVEDAYGNLVLADYDGMGGTDAGAEAANIGVKTFMTRVRNGTNPAQALADAHQEIRKFIEEQKPTKGSGFNAGAVATALRVKKPVKPNGAHTIDFYWAGDTKGMLLRRGPDGNWAWIYRTKEDGYATKLVQPGVDYEVGGFRQTLALVSHPMANIVINCLGSDDKVEIRTTKDGEIPDSSERTGTRLATGLKEGIALKDGDLALLGSDGFWENFG
ncbi:MAG: FHA domain-containing protein, partial [Deltaproteobacteria bacterium]|nr:FHA domain-containing protein [Deltaproteobacteria bacterium]